VKVKSPLFLTKHHAMKAYWGGELWIHVFLDLAIRWTELLRKGSNGFPFRTGQRNFGFHKIRAFHKAKYSTELLIWKS
jgi:hypothetical protein